MKREAFAATTLTFCFGHPSLLAVSWRAPCKATKRAASLAERRILILCRVLTCRVPKFGLVIRRSPAIDYNLDDTLSLSLLLRNVNVDPTGPSRGNGSVVAQKVIVTELQSKIDTDFVMAINSVLIKY